MAVGGQIVAKGAVANGARLSYQPSGSTEALVTCISLKLQASASVELNDGSAQYHMTSGDTLQDRGGQVAIPVSNAVFVSCLNSTGGSQNFALVGVQTL